jgi:hypothetical protein
MCGRMKKGIFIVKHKQNTSNDELRQSLFETQKMKKKIRHNDNQTKIPR